MASIAALAFAGLATPVSAGSEPSTKVVRCGERSCLQVSGHRDDPSAIVSLNGQAVSVEGKHGWRVRIPVETVRAWSEPYARTIEVSLRSPETQSEAIASVDLPIGLLGGVDLTALVVSVY